MKQKKEGKLPQFIRYNPGAVLLTQGTHLHIHIQNINGYFKVGKQLRKSGNTFVYELETIQIQGE